MLIFIDEDRAYRYWVAHHRNGFVVDGRFKPKWSRLELHRAECHLINQAKSRWSHWTTGSRFKACALHRDELVQWAHNRLGVTCSTCAECSPDTDLPNGLYHRCHLTPQCKAILEYVLEAASIHFEDESPPYHVTVEMIAAYLGKTPPQISSALHYLVDEGYLQCDRHPVPGKPFQSGVVVYPTQMALRTLPEYAECSKEKLATELAKLGWNSSICSHR
jgi:hypothetical protein